MLETGFAVHASTRISGEGRHARAVGIQGFKALIQQSGLGSCLGIGIALPSIVELTTMQAGRAAINVVYLNMIMVVAQ